MKAMQLSFCDINAVHGQKIFPHCSTKISDLLKNLKTLRMIILLITHYVLILSTNIADDSISSKDVQSFFTAGSHR